MNGVSRRRVLIAGATLVVPAIAGCSGDDGGDEDPTDRGPIAVDELTFTAVRPSGYDDYRSQPEAAYDRDDAVWIYTALSGISGESIEDEASGGEESGENGSGTEGSAVEIHVVQTLTVEDPDGAEVVQGEETFQRTLAVRQLDSFYVGTDVLLPGTAPSGEYTATLTYEDRVSETETTETATFTIT